MGRKTALWLTAFLLVLAFLAGGTAESMHTEVQGSELEVSATLGYDGQITYGKAIPVRVTVKNRGGDFQGIAAVNTYVNALKYDRYETEIFVPAGGERTVTLAVKAETRQPVFTAEILRDGKRVCAVNAYPETVINPSAMLIGVFSSRPRNLAYLDISAESDTLNRYEYWQTVALAPETLPDDPELLRAFGMLVLDDTDPAELTEKQRQAIRDWLREGHVLLCGGGTAAPRNLAMLDTELQVTDFTVSDGVHGALESYAGRRDTNRHPEAALAVIEGKEPLVKDADGNGLLWKIPEGEGAVWILAWEAGDPALSAEPMMHTFFQQVLVRDDPSLYNKLMYGADKNGARYNPGEDARISVNNPMPAAAAVIAGAALLGCAVWIVLKKRGSSSWMWAAAPALSLLAAAGAILLSGSSAMNRPVAAAAVNRVQMPEGNTAVYISVTAAAPRPGVHRYEIAGEDPQLENIEDYYWADEEEDKPTEPVTLRMTRRNGEENSVAMNTSGAWEAVEMSASHTEEETGRVRAEIWMEEDGLHGEVVNESARKLKAGVVVCVWGYVRVPALAPGERAEFALIAEDAKDPLSPVFRDGVMIRNSSSGLYGVTNQLFYGSDGRIEYDSRNSVLQGLISSAADLVTRNRGSRGGSDRESATFIYSAEPENADELTIRADGEEIGSVAVISMVTAEIEYLSVGRTGLVSRSPGMDRAVRCETDGEGMPAGDMEESSQQKHYGYGYSVLDEKPTFRFSPEGLENTEITKLAVCLEEWYTQDVRLYVLNTRRQEWEEASVNKPLTRPQDYLDADGNLYCQFRPVAADVYAEIPAPTLLLEGRVKNVTP